MSVPTVRQKKKMPKRESLGARHYMLFSALQNPRIGSIPPS
jgi:hypothetical protein